MSDLHIDDFFRDAAKILVLLYSQFPRATTLYVEDISGPDEPDEFGLHSPRHESCFQTVLWLGSTGYLSHGALVRQEGTDRTVLTHEAFLLLNSASGNHKIDDGEPPFPDGELTIHRLRDELKQGSSDTLASFMRETMRNFRPEKR